VSKVNIIGRQGSMFTVSGKLRMSGQAPEFASLGLFADDEEPTAWIIGSGMTDGEGGFRFLNVAPGSYSLFYLVGGMQGVSVGRVQVSVTDRDITALGIDAQPPVRLRGTVAVDGSAGAKGIKVALMPTDGIMDPGCFGEAQENGEIVLESCNAGRYIVAVASTARTQYVKQIAYAGADITNDFVTVSDGGAALRVVLRRGAARIRGTLSPPKSGWYVVVPREVPAQVLPAQAQLGHSDSTGSFLIEGLPPGRFAVVGIAAPDVSALHNADALIALASLGTEVQVKESEEAVITVPLMTVP
jgi:hypothetical protein